MPKRLSLEPLTAAAFGPFGTIIEIGDSGGVEINDGWASRFHRVAEIDASGEGGTPIVSLFRSKPRCVPIELTVMERHPLGSQTFIPLQGQRFVVVVATGDATFASNSVRAFLTNGQQGVHYNAGTWHHPLLNVSPDPDFVVIDRDGPDDNCDEIKLNPAWLIDGDGLLSR